MKYIVTLNGKQYEVEVEKGQATAIQTNEVPVVPTAAPQAAPAPSPAASGAETITAPMPGTILQVKCTVGQAVKRGEVLFILEAMKMENEIFAPHDGTVSSIMVAQGATVETGTVLCAL